MAPTAVPVLAASVTPSPTAVPVAAPAATADPDMKFDREEEFDRAIERKIKKHLNINVSGDRSPDSDGDDHWWVPLVILTALVAFFGTPVAVVATIMYFSFSKNRAMHKTVRMMVEKGQPVPESLLNPPPVVRQRSDLRRGITLLMVGTGLIIFLGAVVGRRCLEHRHHPLHDRSRLSPGLEARPPHGCPFPQGVNS